MSRPSGAGELAIVLHGHMPYVEGFGSGRSARSADGRVRAAGHRAALDAALAAPGTLEPTLRELAPDVAPAAC